MLKNKIKTKIRLKKNDEVIVTAGKYKGSRGKIEKVFVADKKVLVDGVNVVKKHIKPTQETPGKIISKSMPIHISNVAFYDPKAKKASKIGCKMVEKGDKMVKCRYAKASGEVIDE